MDLVLSLFPGIGLLDMAFEHEGFCVVRGPDLIFGSDVRRFHVPSGKFDGVIGGPPCQAFWGGMANLSRMVEMQGKEHSFGNLIPEFVRLVREASPKWWVMENVMGAPEPDLPGCLSLVLNNRWLGESQNRKRRFSSNLALASCIQFAALENIDWSPAVLASAGAPKRRDGKRIGYDLAGAIKAQGLPEDFLKYSPFTEVAKRKVIGNGVPLPMGRAIARAVKTALL